MSLRTGLIIFVILFLMSCNKQETYKTYTVLGNAYEMECSYYRADKCGVFLRNCKDGLEYSCLNNIIIKK